VDREGLWFRVLVAKYGIVEGRLQAGGREGSTWWREIVNIRDGFGSLFGSWFPDILRLNVGNGANSFFGWICGLMMSLFECAFAGYMIY
jgi:hypothetical protein